MRLRTSELNGNMFLEVPLLGASIVANDDLGDCYASKTLFEVLE
jgi:hypothetical protein